METKELNTIAESFYTQIPGTEEFLKEGVREEKTAKAFFDTLKKMPKNKFTSIFEVTSIGINMFVFSKGDYKDFFKLPLETQAKATTGSAKIASDLYKTVSGTVKNWFPDSDGKNSAFLKSIGFNNAANKLIAGVGIAFSLIDSVH